MPDLFEDELRLDYPKLYPPALPSYNLDVPHGWQRILRILSDRLKDEPMECLQVKEKFGGLCFYYNGPGSSAICEAIADAEDESWVTCDRCGRPGRLLKRRDWYMVRCPGHADGGSPVSPDQREGLPISAGLHAPRRPGIARGFVDIEEIQLG